MDDDSNFYVLDRKEHKVFKFSRGGKFQGTAQIKIKPIFVSERFMYFVESDEEDNLFLVKMSYEIRS